MESRCTVYKTLELIGKRWSLMIILSIQRSRNNRRQYREIKDDLKGITPRILSKRLKELEEEGIIGKEVDNTRIPINTFYSLTESGKSLTTIIGNVKKWGLKYKFQNKACQATLCRDCGL